MASVTIEAKTRNCVRRIADIHVDCVRAKREAEAIAESGEFTDAMQKAVEGMRSVATLLGFIETEVREELRKAGFEV